MHDATPKAVKLQDYQVPDFLIDETHLTFELGDDKTVVHSKLRMRRNPESSKSSASLILDGQELKLQSVAIDARPLSEDDYAVDENFLTIHSAPNKFVLECVTEIQPQLNTSLEGLYRSQKMYCTQCEAEGFRKITYFLDRPDVMSIYTVKIIADAKKYPVLLSNGNEIERGENNDGAHWVTWHDPFKKPCYLFALVAGDLEFIEDHFKTASGNQVTLRIYVESKDLDKCDHAMQSLKNSMAWDEKVYGREYDLDIFNIVAVDDFNMGAMENKSLNIFNTSCVLANPDTQTDAAFQRVEAVVAHEYFHNWSGNRVTCRDWFQLSLKEGFTVFRDAQFSADMGSPTIKRIEDVGLLRTVQFAEDAGPMSHPVRPESYIEISNFYTVTIYEKGAEVIRMIYKLLGEDGFRKGSDLYFERHDGQAVTCEDFVKAMEDASGVDLIQFRRWYSQAGTPRLNVSANFDASKQQYSLTVKQSCPATPGQKNKAPFHIPLSMALFDQQGSVLVEQVLDVVDEEQTFVFEGISEAPVPSLLRGFSAPVKLSYDYSIDELMFLLMNDTDGFCRWDAGQQLAVQVIQALIRQVQNDETLTMDDRLINALRKLISQQTSDKALLAAMLTLPSENYLAEIAEVADVHAIHAARSFARTEIARHLQEEMLQLYFDNCSDEAYQANAQQIAQRSLKNTCLAYLAAARHPRYVELCLTQFEAAQNMTDVQAALTTLVHHHEGGETEQVLSEFYQRWQSESLVVNQWFQVQATNPMGGNLQRVKALLEHSAYDAKNPNKIRALIGAFSQQNAVNFHQRDGEGYRFLADQVIALDSCNPQVASRMVAPLSKWRKYDQASGQLMKDCLQSILAKPALSKDVYEVVSKSLAD